MRFKHRVWRLSAITIVVCSLLLSDGAAQEADVSSRRLPRPTIVSGASALNGPATVTAAHGEPQYDGLRRANSSEAWTSSENPAARTGASGTLPALSPPNPQVVPASAIEAASDRSATHLSSEVSLTGYEKRTPLAPPSSSTDEAVSQPSESGTLQMLFSVGSSLLLVVGLFLGLVWCYRKTLHTAIGSLPKQVVSVLGRTPLTARQQLVLVRFGSKLVLISLVQGEARTISEIVDPLEVDQLAGICESIQPGSITNSFRAVLQAGGKA